MIAAPDTGPLLLCGLFLLACLFLCSAVAGLFGGSLFPPGGGAAHAPQRRSLGSTQPPWDNGFSRALAGRLCHIF